MEIYIFKRTQHSVNIYIRCDKHLTVLMSSKDYQVYQILCGGYAGTLSYIFDAKENEDEFSYIIVK